MPLFDRTDYKKFTKKVIEDLRSRYRSVYPKIRAVVRDHLQKKLREEFYASDTVQSCINGILLGELGLQEPQASMDAILNKIISTIDVSVSAPRSGGAMLQIRMQAVRSDFEDLLSLAAAEQDWTNAEGTRIKGEPLPWLQWLLIEGNNVIISGYDVTINRGPGRSGVDMQMKKKNADYWKVPSQYQGTVTDNFIIDILRNVEQDLEKNLWRIVRPVIAQLS